MFSRALIGHQYPEHVPEDADTSCMLQTDYMSELKLISEELLQIHLASVVSSVAAWSFQNARENKTQTGKLFSPVREREREGRGVIYWHNQTSEGGNQYTVCPDKSIWLSLDSPSVKLLGFLQSFKTFFSSYHHKIIPHLPSHCAMNHMHGSHVSPHPVTSP